MGPRFRTAGGALAATCVMCLSSATAVPATQLLTAAPGHGAPASARVQEEPGRPVVVPETEPPPATPLAGAESAQTVVRAVQAGDLSIPAVVLAAYQRAADRLALEDPSCRLRWQVLAGIGKIESGHAGGGRVTAAGDAAPRILGPVLDGAGHYAAIGDHDGGRWDGDIVWDRAVGPMQFIPGTWIVFGADGSGDGVADPNNVFDATLSAGRYLCVGTADLTTETGLRAALRRYNNSAAYVANVLRWIYAYDAGRAVPVDGTGPGGETAVAAATGASPAPSVSPSPKPTPSWSPSPTPSPTPTTSAPTSPSPSPTPTSTPTPTPCPSPSPSPTPSETPTATPTPSPTATPTPTPSPTPTPTPTPSPSATECAPAGP